MSTFKLNLPHTLFPMRAQLAKTEPHRVARWLATNVYESIMLKAEGWPEFILHDGPPYANGQIHLGHALNKILKDITLKSRRLEGFCAPFVPGWDCHGLPIEIQVEQSLAKPVSKPDFRSLCRSHAQAAIEVQKKGFQRLGVLADWDHCYQTSHPEVEGNTIKLLADLMEKGYVNKGVLPVHWCVCCKSALAEAEVEYQEVNSTAVYVQFQVANAESLSAILRTENIQKPVYVLIWTTTPWTLPANKAVLFHPNAEYVFVETSEGIYCASANFAQNPVFESSQVIATCIGSSLPKISLIPPFFKESRIPLLSAEHVEAEVGTGFVHTAPAHGPEDFYFGKENGLPLENPYVDDAGCFTESLSADLAGVSIWDSAEKICTYLEKTKQLFKAEVYTHAYPHCWRHKKPLFYRVTPQWFIPMHALRDKALASIKAVQWLPKWGEHRMQAMLERRPDWCISRQRSWGVPLPILVHKSTGEVHPKSPEIMRKVGEAVEKQGLEAWWSSKPEDWLPLEEADWYEAEEAVLDVWFDSGASFASILPSTLKRTTPQQADLYLEGSDQYRGWFMASLLLSVARQDKPPFKEVFSHGFAVDADGRKMSKSLGNVISPEEIISEYGADVLRLWVASTDAQVEMSLSKEILQRTSDHYRRIRNTARFLLANLTGFNPETGLLPIDAVIALDRWIIEVAQRYDDQIFKAYSSHQFPQVVQLLVQFCSIELGSIYLEIIKDRHYTSSPNSKAYKSSQTAQYHLLNCLVRWMTPILSFTADELWSYFTWPKEETVFSALRYAFPTNPHSQTEANSQRWTLLLELRQCVLNALEQARQQKRIRDTLEAAVELTLPEAAKELIDPMVEELKFFFLVSKVQCTYSAQTPTVSNSSIVVKIEKASGSKCPRCWHYEEGAAEALCQRCQNNLTNRLSERCFF